LDDADEIEQDDSDDMSVSSDSSDVSKGSRWSFIDDTCESSNCSEQLLNNFNSRERSTREIAQ
jgi:hypothetical protein